MSGLPLIQPETATGQAADLLAAVQKALGVTPNMTKAMANSPAVLKAYLEFSGTLGGGSLTAAVRERIALLVAQENGCDYCLSAHTYIGTKLAGLSQDEATAARKGEADDSQAAAALILATVLVRNQGTVTDEQLTAARQAGLSDGEIAEVVANVALNVFTNYLNKAGRVAIDWPVVTHEH
ncbi:carboxymuconolactone decarboxylase family protein [Nonomuraea basaltis]|uniref:carboxymuconolactone decarboxylase family protein n=1 Tax=Nonomuraea basaltis TaxID=2495887 RepID=UPI00110C6476|nr:carboxymuconolactone decarboxylase family protein [Nonomuraea basaltis]TMR99214.1 carboxymuconolactone decarboxylase family protein [Nonomuraea basaltis]